MKTIRKEHRRIKPFMVILIELLILAVVIVLPRFIPSKIADIYCRNIFPTVSVAGNIFTGIFQISLTENLIVTGAPMLFLLIIAFTVIVLIKCFGRGVGRFVYDVMKKVLVIAIIGGIIFQLMHGMNYQRTPVRKLMRFDNDDYSIEAYEEALHWAYVNMLDARRRLGEDFLGTAHLSEGFEMNVIHANYLVDELSEDYDLGLSQNFVRAKPVSMSKYWSLTQIVGMYDPFLGEANINTGYLDVTDFPHTLCHELAHAKGFASETDCNIIAALACTRSARADFRYAGFLYIYQDLFSVLYRNAVYNGGELPSFLDASQLAPVYRDLKAAGEYWEMISHMFMSDEIAEVSENANDTFLRANGEKGTVTYNVPEDIYVDYYMTYIKGASNA
ncbi:MAG: DUF3810 family protein [Clostridiales bacterium]|nr:DUF3810 family protein [Clostridiales bacterium]